MSVENPVPVWDRPSCWGLPPGHRHCVHGHLRDCPEPGVCAADPPSRLTWVVVAGPMTYLFASEALAVAHREVLMAGGASPMYFARQTDRQVNDLLDAIEDIGGTTVEDLRGHIPRVHSVQWSRDEGRRRMRRG